MPKKFHKIRKIFGHYHEANPINKEKVSISISPATFPLKWNLCDQSANYLAEYFVNFFPAAQHDDQARATIKHSISFVANELMENAVKFHYNTQVSITLTVWLDENMVVFRANNTMNPKGLDNLYAYLETLTTADPAELLVQQLEKNATEGNSGGSGLGFLTMLNDYEAKIGWKIERHRFKPERITVNTMVHLPLSKELTSNGN